MVFIEAPEAMDYKIPREIRDMCVDAGYSVSGNANGKLGNDMDGYDFGPNVLVLGDKDLELVRGQSAAQAIGWCTFFIDMYCLYYFSLFSSKKNFPSSMYLK